MNNTKIICYLAKSFMLDPQQTTTYFKLTVIAFIIISGDAPRLCQLSEVSISKLDRLAWSSFTISHCCRRSAGMVGSTELSVDGPSLPLKLSAAKRCAAHKDYKKKKIQAGIFK